MSKLCEMSNEIQNIIEMSGGYLDIPDEFEDKEAWLDAKEEEYQELFADTVRLYAPNE